MWIPLLRINNTPDLDLPVVIVTVAQPGAAPSELETQVTRRVEDAIAGLGDVRHIISTVVDGASTTAVEFALGKNIDRATNDVRDRIGSVVQNLPEEAPRLSVAIAGVVEPRADPGPRGHRCRVRHPTAARTP